MKTLRVVMRDLAAHDPATAMHVLAARLEEAGFTLENRGGILNPDYHPVGNWCVSDDPETMERVFRQLDENDYDD